jgi:hypothetical protein
MEFSYSDIEGLSGFLENEKPPATEAGRFVVVVPLAEILQKVLTNSRRCARFRQVAPSDLAVLARARHLRSQ